MIYDLSTGARARRASLLVFVCAALVGACSAFVDFGRYSAAGGDGGDVGDVTDAGAVTDVTTPSDASKCGSNVDFPLAALGQPQTVALDFQDAGVQPAFQREGVCPKAVDPTRMAPVRAYVARNLTDAPAVLSAWLVCAANSSASLAFYVGSHVPSTDAELALCATFVAMGAAEGGRGSPDGNGSGRCPGLTKANDGGLVLGPCEEAVIYVQDTTLLYYSDGVSPVGLRAQLE